MWKLVIILLSLFLALPCLSDTFIHRESGEVLHGYCVQKNRGNKTLVRVGEKHSPKYLDLSEYKLDWNYSGRRNQVITLPIKTEIELQCETKAFEEAIEGREVDSKILEQLSVVRKKASLAGTRAEVKTKSNHIYQK